MAKKKVTQRRRPAVPGESKEHSSELLDAESWSAGRATVAISDKSKMARHFVSHDLFTQGKKCIHNRRQITAARIVVNPGTTPNEVVRQVLELVLGWVQEDTGRGKQRVPTPHIIWYTPGSIVPATLYEFRINHPSLRNACGLYMFPGMVDPYLEMVRGEEATRYVNELSQCFTYAILSAYAFDMKSGTAFFFFDDEVRLQKAVALREATHKFLFLDHEKFQREGTPAYTIQELLSTSQTVTIYTVSSERDNVIMNDFERLAAALGADGKPEGAEQKLLRLVIINGHKQVNILKTVNTPASDISPHGN